MRNYRYFDKRLGRTVELEETGEFRVPKDGEYFWSSMESVWLMEPGLVIGKRKILREKRNKPKIVDGSEFFAGKDQFSLLFFKDKISVEGNSLAKAAQKAIEDDLVPENKTFHVLELVYEGGKVIRAHSGKYKGVKKLEVEIELLDR